MYTIYRINFPDGKTYVGCTANLSKRMYIHFKNPINDYSRDQISKYGKDAIQYEALAESVPEYLSGNVERYFILKEGSNSTNKIIPRFFQETTYSRTCRLLGVLWFLVGKNPIRHDAIVNNQKIGVGIKKLMEAGK